MHLVQVQQRHLAHIQPLDLIGAPRLSSARVDLGLFQFRRPLLNPGLVLGLESGRSLMQDSIFLPGQLPSFQSNPIACLVRLVLDHLTLGSAQQGPSLVQVISLGAGHAVDLVGGNRIAGQFVA